MWTEFIAQELRDDKSDTQNLDTKAGHKSWTQKLSWSLWQHGPCVTCVQLRWFLLLIKANNTMWLNQSRSLISSHNWKTQPWGMDWSALQIQLFSVFFLSASSICHPLTSFTGWLPTATEGTCFLSYIHQEQKGIFSTPLNKVPSIMIMGVWICAQGNIMKLTSLGQGYP